MITAEEIKEIRGKLGMLQAELGFVLGVRPSTVSRWEKGTPPEPMQRNLLLALKPLATQEFGNALKLASLQGPLFALHQLLVKKFEDQT